MEDQKFKHFWYLFSSCSYKWNNTSQAFPLYKVTKTVSVEFIDISVLAVKVVTKLPNFVTVLDFSSGISNLNLFFLNSVMFSFVYFSPLNSISEIPLILLSFYFFL